MRVPALRARDEFFRVGGSALIGMLDAGLRSDDADPPSPWCASAGPQREHQPRATMTVTPSRSCSRFRRRRFRVNRKCSALHSPKQLQKRGRIEHCGLLDERLIHVSPQDAQVCTRELDLVPESRGRLA